MIVRPDDLSNLCVLFSVAGAARIAKYDLERLIQRSMSIDAYSSAAEVITTAAACSLVKLGGHNVAITTVGHRLAKQQDHKIGKISDSAKVFLLKNVYLNPRSGAFCCLPFVTSFYVDMILETFVLDRTDTESEEQRRWLRILNRVGFLDVNEHAASVKKEYLSIMNECLQDFRNITSDEEAVSSADKTKTGEIAERCALEFEAKRLVKLGHSELVPLIRQISLVDTSAGYDIISCRGTGNNPEEEILIEVKGTRQSHVQFIWTRNERRVAKSRRRSYCLYIFTDINFDAETGKGPTVINNPWSRLQRLGYCVEPLDVQVKASSKAGRTPKLR